MTSSHNPGLHENGIEQVSCLTKQLVSGSQASTCGALNFSHLKRTKATRGRPQPVEQGLSKRAPQAVHHVFQKRFPP